MVSVQPANNVRPDDGLRRLAGVLMNKAHRQRKTLAWVKEMEGEFAYYHEAWSGGMAADVAPPPGPEWLRNLVGIDFFADVALISCNDAQINDVTPFASLTHLARLNLDGTQVTDLTPLAALLLGCREGWEVAARLISSLSGRPSPAPVAP